MSSREETREKQREKENLRKETTEIQPAVNYKRTQIANKKKLRATEKQIDKQMDIEMHREIGKQMKVKTDRQRDRKIERNKFQFL